MNIYKNITGTIKPSFKLGSRGIELSTSILTDTTSGKNLNKLLVDGRAVVTEDQIIISRACVTSLEQNSDGTATLIYKYYDSNNKLQQNVIKVYTDQKNIENDAYIKGPDSSIEGTIPLFKGENGKELSNSNLKVISKFINSSGDEEHEIPTVSLMKEYIGIVEEPLRKLRDGYEE